jgi:hypothetical protein
MIVLVIVGFVVVLDVAYRSWREHKLERAKKLS